MKTSLTRSKSSLIFILGILSLSLFAKPVAQVTEVSGQVFIVSPDGKTKALKLNDHMEEKSDVMVEEGSHITFNDYYDSTYHLIGGTHVKFFDKSVQLKRGKAWIQSHNGRHPLALTTANGHVDFWKGEFVTTFDQSTSRTQVLTVNGEVEVSNVLNRDLKHTVAAGTFSLIDPEVDDGSPRTPVKVGLSSLNEALSEFKNLPKKITETTPTRSIASVEEEPIKKGEIIFMTSGRLPASVQGEAHHYYKKKSAKPLPKQASVDAEIKYYGSTWKTENVTQNVGSSKVVQSPRKPASVSVQNGLIESKGPSREALFDEEFSSSLKKHSVEQPKYSKELDSLIDDLKSY